MTSGKTIDTEVASPGAASAATKQSFRQDQDTLGSVNVPHDALWQAQTQRSLENFPFGMNERQPQEIIYALSIIKQACAEVNKKNGVLPDQIADSIITSAQSLRCRDISTLSGTDGGCTDDIDLPIIDVSSFPLSIWQTGSGTQTNMNMNEVLASMSNELILGKGKGIGLKSPVHPNDHVNKSQSSNDVFPSALTLSCVMMLNKQLFPALDIMISAFDEKIAKYHDVIKIGRTHMMDAVPLTFSQELGAYRSSLVMCKEHLAATLKLFNFLALGGTAVGTGLGTYQSFDQKVCQVISGLVGMEIFSAPDKFFALSQQTPSVALAGALITLATAVMKMVDDIRILASGPRTGLAEIILPTNEPGSSIMPGKVNPTQCESLSMICLQVVGNCTAIINANTHGHLQLNVFLPLIASNLLRSIRLLSRGLVNFVHRALNGLQPDCKVMAKHLNTSLMLVTALAARIGYDAAARAAKTAHEQGLTLKQACVQLGCVADGAEYDRLVVPSQMVMPSS